MRHVKCHDCGEIVMEVVQPIAWGDTIEASQFRGINGYPSPEFGNVIACPNCKSEWGLRKGMEEATGYPVM